MTLWYKHIWGRGPKNNTVPPCYGRGSQIFASSRPAHCDGVMCDAWRGCDAVWRGVTFLWPGRGPEMMPGQGHANGLGNGQLGWDTETQQQGSHIALRIRRENGLTQLFYWSQPYQYWQYKHPLMASVISVLSLQADTSLKKYVSNISSIVLWPQEPTLTPSVLSSSSTPWWCLLCAQCLTNINTVSPPPPTPLPDDGPV